MEPIPQISKALEIIENVQKSWEDVWVNKIQCKRVVDRFKAIGELLKIYRTTGAGSNCDDNTLSYPAFDELLTVLQKGQALVSTYVNRTGITSVLTSSNNRKAFKEIHDELETMKAKFPFDRYGDQFEIASWSQRDAMLTQDAEQDLEALKSLPDQSLPPEVVRVALEKVALESTDDSRLPSYHRIDMSEITIKDPVRKQEMLSKPATDDFWAIVCEGSWLSCDFAVKVFKSKKLQGSSEWNEDQMTREVGTLLELRHPHIVPIVGFAQGPEMCAVLMELMPERDLRHFIKNHAPAGPRPFTRSQELDIITQIARGMLYLHTREYVHGDLKCSNILMKKYGDYIEVKIGDLRFAEKLQNNGGRSTTMQRARWTPLEALENYGGVRPTDDLRKQADVYSFAMTCYEIITGKWPFHDIQGDALIKMIKGGQRPELPEDLEQSGLKGLIESCWADDPNARPIFEHICGRLDTIRSSMRVVTNKSPGKVSKAHKFFLRCCSAANSQSTTWESEGAAEIDISVPQCPEIKHEAISKVKRLGVGASAKVYEVKWMGCTFAMKRFNESASPSSSTEVHRHELNFLIRLRHPYIIQLVGLSADKKGRCLIVMEYMKGSLRDLINTRISKSSAAWKPRDSKRVKKVMLPFKLGEEELSIISKLAQGMAFLHSRGIAHRDLKAKNVLCQELAEGCFDVKIVDFGESQMIAEAGGAVGEGTGYWRAPEILPTPENRANRSRECDVNLMATDVYSFAMTCYEIVTGLVPFFLEFGEVLNQDYHEVIGGRRPELPDDLDTRLKNLIEDCWHSDPALRPKFVQICTRLNDLSPH